MQRSFALVVVFALGGCDRLFGLERPVDAPIADGAGSMIVFDGVDDFISFTRPVADDFTIELWFRTMQPGDGTSWPSGTGLVYGDGPGSFVNDFGLSLGAGPVMFGVGNPDLTVASNVGVADAEWHHVAATRSRATGEIALYLDGAFQMRLVHENTSALDAVQKYMIGQAHSFTEVPYFRGELDELRIWSIVRTPAELMTNLDRVLVGTEPGLVTYYRFDDGLGLRATDSSAGNNPGSLGDTLETRAPMWMPSTAPLFGR